MTTDVPKMFENNIELVGYSMSKGAAQKIYEKTDELLNNEMLLLIDYIEKVKQK